MTRLLHLPGLIDIHVHFRDPGETHKEDLYSGTCSALAGGITTVFDMPNNIKPLFTNDSLIEKLKIARSKAVCDWGLYFGTDGQNTDLFEKVADQVVGLKLYLSLTTGKYVVGDEELVRKIFQSWPREKVLVAHAEGDRIDMSISMCQEYGNKMHITHVTKKIDLEKIIQAKKDKLPITCDVTPHHLFLTKEHVMKLGSFALMKPPLMSEKDQQFLWNNLDKIDCIASDHGPHTVEEKQSEKPPYGVPGLETMLPLLLTAVSQGRLSVDEVMRLTYQNPQKIFAISQDKGTYIEIDRDEKWIIENKNLMTKCGWSPFNGWPVKGKIKRVYIRNKLVFDQGKIIAKSGFGKSVELY